LTARLDIVQEQIRIRKQFCGFCGSTRLSRRRRSD